MSYIDPDALHGAMNDLDTAITDNTAALTAGGSVPATFKARLKTFSDGLGGKKGIRDEQKAQLGVAQQDYAKAAADNYTGFSDLIDAVAAGVGKKTPEGKRILNIRIRLNAAPTHPAAPAPAPASATPGK